MVGVKHFKLYSVDNIEGLFEKVIYMYNKGLVSEARSIIMEMARNQKFEFYNYINDRKKDVSEFAYDFVICCLVQ